MRARNVLAGLLGFVYAGVVLAGIAFPPQGGSSPGGGGWTGTAESDLDMAGNDITGCASVSNTGGASIALSSTAALTCITGALDSTTMSSDKPLWFASGTAMNALKGWSSGILFTNSGGDKVYTFNSNGQISTRATGSFRWSDSSDPESATAATITQSGGVVSFSDDVAVVNSITGGGFTQGFMAGDGVHPTSNPAALTVYASTLHGCYAFDQTTAESIIYEGVMDHHYDSARDLSVTIYVLSTATSGNPVVFTAEIEYIDDSTLDLDSDSFATAETSASTATSATAGICVPVTFSLSNAEADSIVAGAPYRLRIARAPANAGDTLAADALVVRTVVAQ